MKAEIFEKYFLYAEENGKIVDVNKTAFNLADEAFSLFKSLYNTDYGSIEEDDNLISIHTGGWSYNEELISEFEKTAWWHRYHKITTSGGHYYFDTDFYADKKWEVRTNQSELSAKIEQLKKEFTDKKIRELNPIWVRDEILKRLEQ